MAVSSAPVNNELDLTGARLAGAFKVFGGGAFFGAGLHGGMAGMGHEGRLNCATLVRLRELLQKRALLPSRQNSA